jgi:phage tail sheath protein FI
MASYTAPGVYVKDVVSGSQTIDQLSSSVGAMLGVTKSGEVGVAHKIGSWTEFIEKYANGLDTPFMTNSYLPYSVYGFFANGGKELYIGRVAKNAVKATKTSTGGVTATAKYEGTWGNDVKITIAQSEDYNADTNPAFNVKVAVGTSDSVTISDVTVDDVENKVMSDLKVQSWLSSFTIDSSKGLTAEEFTLAGGTDGDELKDSDYTDALHMLDTADDVTLVAIPGQTSKAINDAIMSYCDNNRLFPIIDMPMGSTPEETKAYRKSISAWTGALPTPWGKVNDPLTNTLKLVPAAGHMMGVYARTIENCGVYKAPAGTEAVVRGFVEMERVLTPSEISTLNPIGVICIVSRPNAGIVLWGARSLNSTDTTMRYVSDGLLNLNIKRSLDRGTQFAVFEPNDEHLWSRVKTACSAFLETLRSEGALKGSADEAYYVTCDATNNTDATINAGQLNIEVGYAPVKPAEFVIIKLAHSIVSEG